ncbi:unnamed protein product [Adineta steineri]|uniref:Fucosyltransferase n=1 Tax=Adineta steineri TaxID=433720 RepID=A0A818MB60_9BILA|nr:unnamed protein product [Adineta steineri]CAF3586008.1 unnamed protein product [Adineta steineri]
MKYFSKRQRKLLWKALCISIVITLIVYIFVINYIVQLEEEINLCEFDKHKSNDRIKYIFNLAYWRILIYNEQIFSKENQTLWCNIPDELQLISKTICQIYNIHDCTRLPCRMIYSSPNTLKDVNCTYDGRIFKVNNDSSIQNQPDLTCKMDYSLDLFIKKSSDYSYPSMIVDAFIPLLTYEYKNILNNKYRSCDSMWGVTFNFESISNYPWAADRKKLKLFDVTFGYDRSLYDFIPHPWLYDYIEQINSTSRRLSMQQVMSNKVPINSTTYSDIYWTNKEMNSNGQNKTANESYVKSSILWMNSNCNTKSQRTQYMEQLMKYIDVDNYGNCGSNKLPLPEHIIKIRGSNNHNSSDRSSYNWQGVKLALAKEYLFTIAIENSLDFDYITEKLWQPLVAGSVPIYLGAPNIHDWLPCQTDCIIDLNKFKTPQDAAMHIKQVATNRTLYESYHKWRNEPVSLQFQSVLNYFSTIRNYSLECILCGMSKQVDQNKDPKEYKNKIIKTIRHF